ncbi:Terminase-like family protein [Phaeobacter inhibens]|uniref:Terminase-like family protein n=1 Tax=Phaeobacter inhibens TaxID=221822 RepID=A0ABN5GTI4_9RHOB|nr:phage terminase large subunit [Phaeobacter inhibens]AUQ95956.1 Terminase-like family protein [Phaeobacter inhibens]
MPRANAINPITGKRYGWEAEQEAKKLADPAHQQAQLQQEIALLERQEAAVRARDDLMAFTKFTMPDAADPNDISKSAYRDQLFHRKVAQILTLFEKGELKHADGTPCTQVIFAMPPRHGKTELATKRNTAWISGRHPDWNIAVGSYSDTMAQDFGADTRAILTSSQFKQIFPKHKLKRGGNAKDNMQTEKGGRLVFVGRGGALTGRGAHVLLIDDLYKDHEEARSKTIREQAWNWFTKVAMTRRMGRKLVMITMTRWHSDDIVGRITDPENPCYDAIEAKKWMIIRIPAIAEEDDPLGREEGEALWEEDYGLDFLQSQQRLDPLGFAALYQQRPTVADGVLFRRENIQRYDMSDLPEDLRFYGASDHAVATGQRNDYSCFGKVGVDRQDNIWLVDLFRQKVSSDIAVEAMLTMAGGNMRPLLWWAERGHISKSIGPFLYKRMAETGTYMNVVEVTPIGDKEQRAQSIAARVAMGKVFIPKGPQFEWLVEEMLAFPNGTHDDGVDMLSLLGLGLQSQFGASAAKPKPAEPKFGTIAWVKQQEKLAERHRRSAEDW